MCALQYVDKPNYTALILRKNYSDLALPGAIMDRAHHWLQGTDARWVASEKTFVFPSGARLVFGYLQSEKDKYRYQSSEFQCICFDEVTQFPESQYLYLWSRLRRGKADSDIPLRMRVATNPGNIGHEWVKRRFITGDVPFVPSLLEDNPSLDQKKYVESLSNLDAVTREQLLSGNWDITEEGMFRREWFRIIEVPQVPKFTCRYWDLAASEKSFASDPDWTVGCKMQVDSQGNFTVVDVTRFRKSPFDVEQLVKQTVMLDGKSCYQVMEEEGGSSGKAVIEHYQRALVGYPFKGVRSTGSKAVRATPFASCCEAGRVHLLRGVWNDDFLSELSLFPFGAHDDQVDAASGAFNALSQNVFAPPLRAFKFG